MTEPAQQQQNLEQIRHLLFGQYVNQYDSHLGQLDSQYLDIESALHKEIVNTEQKFYTEIQSIREHLTQEITQLNHQLNAEQKTNTEQHQDIHQAIQDLEQQLEQKLSQANARFIQESRQLRDIVKDFIVQVRKQNEQNAALFTELKQEVADLQAQKLNRQDLAGFFSELVPRLSSQLTAGITDDKS